MTEPTNVLTQLMATIEDRKAKAPAKSYTTQLLAGGVQRIGGKLLEEAAEVVDAAHSVQTPSGRGHVTHEAADLLYHLLVLLSYCEVSLGEVEAELARRFGVSGLDEKAARRGTQGG
jgi:phosphoribosyl-ATP pyrophosphohydrolase